MSDIIVCNDADLRQTLGEKALCDATGPVLARTYPGYRWRVEARSGVVIIRNEMTNCKWAYVLHPDKSFSATDWHDKVVRAGGEILERYNLWRSGFNMGNWLDRPRDFTGITRPDL